MKILKIFLSFLFIITIFYLSHARSLALECGDDLPTQNSDQLEEYIASCKAKLQQLQGQKQTLASAIAYFDSQINLTQAKIAQTQAQLHILKLEIDDLSTKIDNLDYSLNNLTKAFLSRTRQAYKIQFTLQHGGLINQTHTLTNLLYALEYLHKIRQHDRQLLLQLETSRLTYDKQKQMKEEKTRQITSLQTQLYHQQNLLASQKAAKTKLLHDTQNSEQRYQQLLTQAQKQLAAFSRFVSNRGGAALLTNQTSCDDWGCYYNQRDTQWGLKAIGLSDSSMAEYGCLVTSMAMIATHYGHHLTPLDIASSPNPFWGNTAYMLQGSWSVAGVTMTRTRVGYSRQDLDKELFSGQPVIVGIYSGPDHFLVVKRKEGDDYLINDPFVANGHDIKFTSQYPLSAITAVDRVRVH